MNDQDRDLIAALAEGRLSGPTADDALARIETDPEMSAEYADQIAALEFLNSGAVPRMTASERETLHVNLTEQLGLVPKTMPVPAPAKRKIPWWQPAFGVATAAAIVAAIVILPGTLTGGSEDDLDSSGGEETQTTAAAAQVQEAPAADGQAFVEEQEIAVYEVYETDSVKLGDLLDQAQGAVTPDDVSSRLAPRRSSIPSRSWNVSTSSSRTFPQESRDSFLWERRMLMVRRSRIWGSTSVRAWNQR